MAEDFVYIRLSDHGNDVPPGRVSRQAFDKIWSGKGFVIVPDEEAELIGSPATQAEMRGATSEPASEAAVTGDAETTTTTRKKG